MTAPHMGNGGSTQIELLPRARSPGSRWQGNGGAGGPRVLDERLRGTRFLNHTTKSLINPPESTRMGFWSINPYVGCEFGCSYCYARDTHRYLMERQENGTAGKSYGKPGRVPAPWISFEKEIFVKERETTLETLERDLAKVFARGAVEPIVIGTSTDPYQPAEETYRVTRSILERLAVHQGLAIGIISKSGLITRDIDLLREIHERHRLVVYVSIISTDASLIRTFEPRTPTPEVRLSALKRLTHAGIPAGLIVAPVLPGVTDRTEHIETLFEQADRAGAKFLFPVPLRLYPSVAPNVLPILEQHYPKLAAQYRDAYGQGVSPPRRYLNKLKARFNRVAARFPHIATKDVMRINQSPSPRRRFTGPQPTTRQLALWR